jgi:periplasmic protein CpxP/Spy
LKSRRNKPVALQRYVILCGAQPIMNLTTRAAPFLAVAAAALCLSCGAFAQDQAAPAAPGAGMHHGADRAEWKKDREARMAARQERRAQRLHDILNIRSDQEPAFHAFLADIKPMPRDHKDGGDHKDWAEHKDSAQAAPQAAPMTTPERLDRMAAMMAKRTGERQARFQQRAEAVKRFYAVLGPEQKRAFDALHAMRGGMRGGRGGMRHGGGEGGHGDWGGGHEHGEDSAAG